MKMELVMWHHNRDLAVARGLASNTEHMYPYTDVFSHADPIACRYLWDHHCYEPVAILKPSVFRKPATIVSREILDLCEEIYKETQHGVDPDLPGGWNQTKDGKRRETETFIALHRTDNRSSMTGDIVEVNMQRDDDKLQTSLYIVSMVGFTVFHTRTHTLQTKKG